VDVRIEVVGPRPGEKMHEELLTAEEGTTATRHEKIFCARKSGGPDDLFYERLAALFEAAEACDDEKVRAILKEMLPYYEPQPQAHDYRNVAPYPFDALSIQR